MQNTTIFIFYFRYREYTHFRSSFFSLAFSTFFIIYFLFGIIDFERRYLFHVYLVAMMVIVSTCFRNGEKGKEFFKIEKEDTEGKKTVSLTIFPE